MQSYMPVAHIALTCLIEGESSLFSVKPKEDINIMDLKELIKEEGINGVLGRVDAKDLILWKVRMIMGQRHRGGFSDTRRA
jgi:hypothetical protein